MNSLCRALVHSASYPTSRKRLLLHPTTFILQSYSTATNATTARRKFKPLRTSPPPPSPNDVDDIERPKEIPFQPKVANSVNLIGHIRKPIHFQTSLSGNSWAGTIICREQYSGSHSLLIPIIFEGDLAHIAACHLKENDCIHIDGQLSADPPYLDANKGQDNLQVLVRSLNFVQGYSELQKRSAPHQQEESLSSSVASGKHNINQSRKALLTSVKDDMLFENEKDAKHDMIGIDPAWKDLLSNPDEWWDLRSTEDKAKGAAFERKKNGELLFIDNSTPKWIKEKLESMKFEPRSEPNEWKVSAKKNVNSVLSSWRDLLDDPKQWWDCRENKISPKYPDFKSKDGSLALWLSKAPQWVLSKLEEVEFDVYNVKSKQAKEHKSDEAWKNLVENPEKWWDNRSKKLNKRSPDFKHKETGEALWLTNSPSWVMSKLPPFKI
ncbi:Protein OSB3, chloroplastic/mitochondrial [Quillaja saponaria]|uniref:Protein OSB3, chloroplastic/mitochondrial n=1 Tax=Quillaja saponaria TaxID=32244 RepID=A0AAD7Q2Z9_QUISA|nr:Protein OSB3, chloroplastic/mitochondrial [Quillaja saponaria]